jgi:hypothetical protein
MNIPFSPHSPSRAFLCLSFTDDLMRNSGEADGGINK